MAIIGLTGRKDYQPNRAIPRLGKLRKGAPKPEKGNRPGSDLDYFRVTFDPQYSYLQDTFVDLYGNEPTQFNVKFVGKTVEDVFPTGYEARNATTLLHLCDGEQQQQHWNDKTKQYDRTPIACAKGNDPNNFVCGCKQIGRLNITLPDLTDATGVMGKFVIETHSIFDIMKLFNQLMFLEDMFGQLMWLPAIVGRAKNEKSYTMQDGKKKKKDYSLMYIKYYVPMLKEYMQPQLPETGQLMLDNGDGINSKIEYLPEPTQAPALEIDPLKIVEWFHSVGIDLTLTEQDVIEAFHQNEFDYMTAEKKMIPYAIALIFGHRYDDLGAIERDVTLLFPTNGQAVRYIMSVVTGD